jgi:Hemagglutinin repeat/Extended Signal Peptide of Type V secretion system
VSFCGAGKLGIEAMNYQAHALTYNRTRGCVVPVPETAKSSGKGAVGSARGSRKKPQQQERHQAAFVLTVQGTSIEATSFINKSRGDTNIEGVSLTASKLAYIDANNISIKGVQESQTKSSSTSSESYTASAAKLQQDRVQVAGAKDSKTENTHTETTTTVKSAALNVGALTLKAQNNIELLSVDATIKDDLDMSAGKNVTVGGMKGGTTNSDKTQTETKEMSVGVRNAYVDAVRSVQALDKAKQAVNEANEALKQAEGRIAKGELDPSALDDYKANVAMATANLGQASLNVAKAGAAAAATTATGGFTGDISASVTKTTTESTNSQEKYYGSRLNVGGNTNITADNRIDLLGLDAKLQGDASLKAKSINIAAVEQKGSSSSSSVTEGASGGYSTSGNVNAGVNQQKSSLSSSSTSWAQGQLNVGGKLSTQADDTSIKGAQVTANELDIISKTLTIASVQDSATSSSKSQGFNLGYGGSTQGNNPGGSVSAGVNQQSGNSDSRTTSQQTQLIARNGANIQAESTTLIGATLASDKNKLDLRTNSLSTQDLNDYSKSSSSGFSVSSGASASAGNVGKVSTVSTVTVGANRSGHEMQGQTLATIGGGSIKRLDDGSDIQTTANRDTTKTQVVTKNMDTGGLNASATLDTRVLTQEGRNSIAKDFKDSKEHVEDIGAAVVKVAGSDSLGVLNLGSLVNQNAQTSQLLSQLKNSTDPQDQQLLKDLGLGQGDAFTAAEQKLAGLLQERLGAKPGELNFFDKSKTTSASLQDKTNADGSVDVVKGATVKDAGNSQNGNAFVGVSEDANRLDLTQTVGQEVGRTVNNDGVIFKNSDQTKTALAENLGERLAMRTDAATDGALSSEKNNTGAFAQSLLNSQSVKTGTEKSNEVGNANVEYRLTAKQQAKAEAETKAKGNTQAAVRVGDKWAAISDTQDKALSGATAAKDAFAQAKTPQDKQAAYEQLKAAYQEVANTAAGLNKEGDGSGAKVYSLSAMSTYITLQIAAAEMGEKAPALTAQQRDAMGKQLMEMGMALDAAEGAQGMAAMRAVQAKLGAAAAETKAINTLADEAKQANAALTKKGGTVGDEAYVAPKHTSSDVFQTHGLTTDQVPANIKNQLTKDLEATYGAGAADKVKEWIESGRTVPVPMQASSETKLYKITASENPRSPSPITEYFVDGTQLQRLQQNPQLASEFLGLPPQSQSSSSTFRVYEMQPKPGETPTVYQSQVAPTTAIVPNQTNVGNATQTLVPNRNLWTTPKPVDIKIGGQP